MSVPWVEGLVHLWSQCVCRMVEIRSDVVSAFLESAGAWIRSCVKVTKTLSVDAGAEIL